MVKTRQTRRQAARAERLIAIEQYLNETFPGWKVEITATVDGSFASVRITRR